MDEIESIFNNYNPDDSTPDAVMEKMKQDIVDEKTVAW